MFSRRAAALLDYVFTEAISKDCGRVRTTARSSEVIDAAARNQVAIEINDHYRRFGFATNISSCPAPGARKPSSAKAKRFTSASLRRSL